MDYRVLVTDDAKADLDSYVWYLVTQKRNTQAAANLLGDYDVTIDELSVVAGSLKYCENEKLKTEVISESILKSIVILCCTDWRMMWCM